MLLTKHKNVQKLIISYPLNRIVTDLYIPERNIKRLILRGSSVKKNQLSYGGRQNTKTVNTRLPQTSDAGRPFDVICSAARWFRYKCYSAISPQCNMTWESCVKKGFRQLNFIWLAFRYIVYRDIGCVALKVQMIWKDLKRICILTNND